MVDAAKWVEQNYPINDTCQNKDDTENYGKKRTEVINFDISNKFLQGPLHLGGFSNVNKINISFNDLSFVTWDGNTSSNLEVMDFSYNQIVGPYSNLVKYLFRLEIFNFSHNNLKGLNNLNAPRLTHLDISNNLLTELDLQNSKNLFELNCSDNPLLNNLTLSPFASPAIIGECARLVSSQASNILSASDKVSLGIGLGVGLPTCIALIAIGLWIWRKHHSTKKEENNESAVNHGEIETEPVNQQVRWYKDKKTLFAIIGLLITLLGSVVVPLILKYT